ncbi:MAG: PIG-L family deacetylase [Verrucomicrobiota bacterium]
MATLLAIGAHYDDCVFGVPGILLQGVRKHYRVVILSLIGDYTNWAPVKGREQELVEASKRLAQERGVEMRFLNFASHRYDASLDNIKTVARAVADIQPDIALMLWKEDNHNDHMAASELSRVALRHAGQILDAITYRPPRAIYSYDNGPRHTIGFEPNTYVDVSDVWPEAIAWLGQLMAVVANKPFDPKQEHAAQRAKETLARYRGAACGARYAEALWSPLPRPQEIL